MHEPVEPARLTLRWLLLRALRGGQDFARHRLAGRLGALSRRWPRALVPARLAANGLAAVLALLSWPPAGIAPRYWLLKASANLGKMSIFLGWHYREYGPRGP